MITTKEKLYFDNGRARERERILNLIDDNPFLFIDIDGKEELKAKITKGLKIYDKNRLRLNKLKEFRTK